jgi:hypothetical protein
MDFFDVHFVLTGFHYTPTPLLFAFFDLFLLVYLKKGRTTP